MWSLTVLKGGWRGWLRRWVRLILWTRFHTCWPCIIHNLSMSKTAKFAPQWFQSLIYDVYDFSHSSPLTLLHIHLISLLNTFAFMVGTMMTTMMSWKRDPLDEQLQTLSNPGFRSAQVNGIETCSPNILISSTCKLLTILCIWVCMSSRASSLCSVLMCHSRRWVRSSMRKTSVVTLETYSRPFAPAFSALADAEGPCGNITRKRHVGAWCWWWSWMFMESWLHPSTFSLNSCGAVIVSTTIDVWGEFGVQYDSPSLVVVHEMCRALLHVPRCQNTLWWPHSYTNVRTWGR